MADDNEELEAFRRQWQEEVSAKTKRPETRQRSQAPSVKFAGDIRRKPLVPHPAAGRQEEDEFDDKATTTAPAPHSADELAEQVRSLSVTHGDDDTFSREPDTQLNSALEHFEEAAKKEAQGNLGASLDLYRKAYRLDSKVDKTYRTKHFPPSSLKIPDSRSSKAPIPSSSATQNSSDSPTLPTAELIASFAGLPIPGADPIIENTPPPPCPISEIPSEVLLEILRYVALQDPASFGRLALVCKRLAYHVAHEQHIWRRLCQSHEFGFAAMHYVFACDINGLPVYSLMPRYNPFPLDTPSLEIPKPLSSWSQVFQTFPRIRFTGIYISTANYTRPGANSALHSVSWNTPIHIVTYYRYLRFYPDGSVISLLSTTEPVDVVPHVSKENLETLRNPAPAHRRHQHQQSDSNPAGPGVGPLANPIPSVAAAALKYACRGRWHLTNPSLPSAPPDQQDTESASHSSPLSLPAFDPLPPASRIHPNSKDTPDPRDLFIETEGVHPKYTNNMHLSLRSTGSSTSARQPSNSNSAKNTKLVWRGFWSYNRLTDDWGEYGLRNDRAFVFRRVRGWGLS
ncbi:hypothetical protein AJ80_08973 [Polytolypa hystricis UAMH7299]|uniref:F-box domain-containing protein n=1 Tax=Polytolypa hystricis (strain UAMH7299) TaxID=1447883 RepID=A0A2B7WY23_POLH7|nr:hypothetical protein AJ80_08973 [Polytolypa hystricis UAMH7299]